MDYVDSGQRRLPVIVQDDIYSVRGQVFGVVYELSLSATRRNKGPRKGLEKHTHAKDPRLKKQ
ncbi:MAG: hypothetical protein WBF58_04170 [Xanthobacteraceae bacterium]